MVVHIVARKVILKRIAVVMLVLSASIYIGAHPSEKAVVRAISRRIGSTIVLAALLCLFFSPTFRFILRGKLFGNSNLFGSHTAAGGYNHSNMMMEGGGSGAPYMGGSGPWDYRWRQQEQLTSLAVFGIALGAFALICLIG